MRGKIYRGFVGVRKKTSIGQRWIKTSSMNKSKRRSYKKYRGQGK